MSPDPATSAPLPRRAPRASLSAPSRTLPGAPSRPGRQDPAVRPRSVLANAFRRRGRRTAAPARRLELTAARGSPRRVAVRPVSFSPAELLRYGGPRPPAAATSETERPPLPTPARRGGKAGRRGAHGRSPAVGTPAS